MLLIREILPLPPKKVFFWFGKEPIESKDLTHYLAKGKEAAHSTAAWAAQTGEGLLLFSKTGEKSAPTGVLNLVCLHALWPHLFTKTWRSLTSHTRPTLRTSRRSAPTSSPSKPVDTSTSSRHQTLRSEMAGSPRSRRLLRRPRLRRKRFSPVRVTKRHSRNSVCTILFLRTACFASRALGCQHANVSLQAQ